MSDAPLVADERFAFGLDSMPEKGRAFEEIWHDRDGAERVLPGFHADWDRYVALYGYPIHARWRYVPSQVTHEL